MQTIRKQIGIRGIVIVAALLAAGLLTLLPESAQAHHLSTPGKVTVTPQDGSLLLSWDRVPVNNVYGRAHSYWVRYRVSSPQGEWKGDNSTMFRIKDGVSVFETGGAGIGSFRDESGGCTDTRCSFNLSNAYITWASQVRQGPYPNLVAGTAYDVQVSAAGTQWSIGPPHHNYATPVSAVFGAPATPEPTVQTTGRDGVNLSWAAVSDNGAEVAGYSVQWKKSSDTEWDPHNYDSGLIPTTHVGILGLETGTQYGFRVRAQNSRGWSPWSAVVTGVPEDTGGL